jgi:phosphomannomutase
MRSRDILVGGEESGGMGFRDHLPERDGLLSALLVLEAVVAAGTTLDGLLGELEAEAGAAAYRRCDYALPPERGRALVASLDAAPPARMGARLVTRLEPLDGRKYWLGDDAWVLVRPSGTEPVLRVYVEAPTREEVDELHRAARELVDRHAPR